MESVPEFAMLFEEMSNRNLLHGLSFAPHVPCSPFHPAFLVVLLLQIVPYCLYLANKYSCRTAGLLAAPFPPHIFVSFKMVTGAILFLKLLYFSTEGKRNHAVLFPESFTFVLSSSSLSEMNYIVPV